METLKEITGYGALVVCIGLVLLMFLAGFCKRPPDNRPSGRKGPPFEP